MSVSPLCPLCFPCRLQSFPFDKQFMQLLVESYWDSNQTSIIWAEPAKIAQLLPDTMPDIVGCQCEGGQRAEAATASSCWYRADPAAPVSSTARPASDFRTVLLVFRFVLFSFVRGLP